MRWSMKRIGAIFLLGCLVLSSTSTAQKLPRPEEFAGFPIGSDGNLVIWEQIVEYFRMAGAASDRILVEEVGRTTNDLPFLLATISAPRNLARLDQ